MIPEPEYTMFRRPRKALFSVALAASLGLAACGPSKPPATVKVHGNVPDATVTVDDMLLGSLRYVSKNKIGLPPGRHRITVERVGYFPWDRLVEVGEEPIDLDVQMVPIPD